MKFRKRPVVIEAYQTDVPMHIDTLEGTMKANAGDWIITGVKGEQYPCKPDIFALTYEPDNGVDELARLRDAAHKNDRWNVETTEGGFRICRGYHERGAGCEWEHFVPSAEIERLREELEAWKATALLATHVVEQLEALKEQKDE